MSAKQAVNYRSSLLNKLVAEAFCPNALVEKGLLKVDTTGLRKGSFIAYQAYLEKASMEIQDFDMSGSI